MKLRLFFAGMFFLCVLTLASNFFHPPIWYLKGFSFWTVDASSYAIGDGDEASYLRSAKCLVGPLTQETIEISPYQTRESYCWPTQNWPPGFPLLIGLVLQLTGEDYYFVKMTLLSIGLWAFVFLVLVSKIVERRSFWISSGLLGSLLWLPVFRRLVVGHGVVYSESVSFAVLVLAFLFFTESLLKQDKKSFMLGSFLFFLLPLVRPIFDPQCLLLLLGTGGVCFFQKCRGQPFFPLCFDKKSFFQHPKMALFWKLCLLFGCLNFPWKFRNAIQYGFFGLSRSALSTIFRMHWDLKPFNDSNVACQLDPALCQVVHENWEVFSGYLPRLSLLMLSKKPFQWLYLKIKAFPYYFWGIDWPLTSENGIYFFENMLYLSAFLTSCILIWKERFFFLSSFRGRVFLMGSFGFIVSYLAPFLIFHYESRYSFPLKIVGVWQLLTAWCLSRQQKQTVGFGSHMNGKE